MDKLITNKFGKFSNKDIEVCKDIDKLRDWLEIVRTSLRFINIGITKGEYNFDKATNDEEDTAEIAERLKGSKVAKQLQGILHDMLVAKISKIKNQEPLPSKRLEELLNEES